MSFFNFFIGDIVIIVRAGAVFNKKIKDRTLNILSQIKEKTHLHFFQ